MTVFDLGRLRHLDLLAAYFELNPDGHKHNDLVMGAASTGTLVKAIVAGTTP